MFQFVYDLPLLMTCPAIVALLCLYSVGGLVIVRRHVLPRLRIQAVDSEFSSGMLQAVMVFYGLALALIAVSVWQTYSDVGKIVSQEATTLAALYRDASCYPEPIRSDLQKSLRDYCDEIIHVAWPMQHHGQTPTMGVVMMNQFQIQITQFEPATEGQKILHAESLRAMNEMFLARRLRVDAVRTHLPGLLWAIIFAGAIISITSAFFFKIDDVRLQAILVCLLAVFIGLVIFMILALDCPFRGDLGVGPEPYELIYQHLMKP